jgi:hypothetical protein
MRKESSAKYLSPNLIKLSASDLTPCEKAKELICSDIKMKVRSFFNLKGLNITIEAKVRNLPQIAFKMIEKRDLEICSEACARAVSTSSKMMP